MRNNSTPMMLEQLFANKNLDNIYTKSLALSNLNNIVEQLLPIKIRPYCRVANYNCCVLTIEVASASWLTRVRYEHESLLLKLRQHKLAGLASIQYKINPELNKTQQLLNCQSSNEQTRYLTTKSASLLLSLAENAPPKLKINLIKLANHATKLDHH